MVRLLGIVARAVVDAFRHIRQQLMGKAEELPNTLIAEGIVHKAPCLLGSHQPAIA
jgi:hypothetical protein